MATWKGEAWLGSNCGRQTVRVQANNFSGAKEQIEQIYGATDVWNLEEERGRNRGGSSSVLSDLGGDGSLSVAELPKIVIMLLLLFVFWGWMVNGSDDEPTKQQSTNKVEMPRRDTNLTGKELTYRVETTRVNVNDPCAIWANANPSLAAKVQHGETCFGY